MGALGGAVVVGPFTAHAQSSPSHPLIGILSPSTSASTALYNSLRVGLRELGRVDGRDISLEVRYAEGDLARLPSSAAELVGLKPDVIVVGSTPGILAVHGATQTIPIVMITLVDPVAIGVAKTIARPGGNVTGVWTFAGGDALIGKRIDLLKEIVPSMSRMGVMVASGDPTDEVVLKLLPAATRALGVTYKIFEFARPRTSKTHSSRRRMMACRRCSSIRARSSYHGGPRLRHWQRAYVCQPSMAIASTPRRGD